MLRISSPILNFRCLLRFIAVFLLFILETTDLFSQKISTNGLSSSGVSSSALSSDNIITIREGFPYCESFETLTPRANTVIDGSRREEGNYVPAIPTLTGNSLRLTSNLPEESGYVYIDYPFASTRGVKVSFEYSSYGKTKSEGADGLSFFMFDGSIDPSTFEIGGKGGALGYTPRKAESSPGIYEVNEPGLKGAYLGIGLDEFGNFGNHYENKRYGFLGKDPMDPVSSWSSPSTASDRYKHTVVLRGPVMETDINRNDAFNFESYEFITGRLLNDLVYPGITGQNPQYFLDPIYPRFTIDVNSGQAIFDCNTIGYRKVFIDLQPDQNSGYYKVNVWMRVNISGTPELIHVIVDEPYKSNPPPFLKIGFAASTGGSNNFHEIKNVSVEVSESGGQDPVSVPYLEEVCQGGELEFEINPVVEQDAYVRCIQLYPTIAEANAAKNAADLINSAQSFDCGISGICSIELCDQDLLTASTEFGDFETFMVEDTNGNFTQKIRFQSSGVLSTTGQVSIYYTVIDNFGQMSAPQSITIDVVPLPEPEISTIDPLTWEESEIDKIYVTLEAMPEGLAYQWFKNGIPVPGAIEETFLVQGNEGVGAYTVEVTTDEGCVGLSSEEVKISLISDISPEHETTRETCSDEGALTIRFDPSSMVGDEKWRIVNSAGEQIYPVAGGWNYFTNEQVSTGQVVVSNLLAGDYIFQVGDSFREGQLGSDGNPLFRHQIPFIIEPIEFPVVINLTKVDEICYGEGGSIFVESSGGLGEYTYELYKDGALFMENPPSLSESSYEFVDVPVGNYDVKVTSGNRCEAFGAEEILAQEPIEVEVSNFKNITCTENDGLIEWIASGGSGVYSFVSLSRDGNILDERDFILTQNRNSFSTSNLPVGLYTLVILDDQGCPVNPTSNQLISSEPKPELSIDFPEEICEEEDVLLEASLINFSLITNPEYTWISPWGDRITNDVTSNGVDFSPIDHDSNPLTPPYLSITGLTSGTYEFSLEMRGENSCNPISEISLVVNPVHQAEYSTVMVSCFDGSDGQISVESIEPSIGDFTFTLLETGETNSTGIFSDLQAGNYTVRINETSASCFSDQIVQIGQPDELIITNPQATNPTCGDSNGSIQFDITGGTPDYEILINGNPISDYFSTISGTTVELKNLPPANYSILVRDANSCEHTPSNLMTLVNDDGVEVNTNPLNEEVCVGVNAVLIPTYASSLPVVPLLKWYRDSTLTQPITNGIDEAGISYQVDPTNGELTIQDLQVGDYTYYVEISGPGICSKFETATVEVFPEITASIDVKDVTCFGGSNGSIQISPVGGNGDFEVSLNSSPFTASTSYTDLPAGSYTVSIRNNVGCLTEKDVEINAPSEAISINNPTIIRASCGLENGSINDLVISGGWGDYNVEWRKGSATGPIVSGELTGAVDLTPDTYFLLVSDSEGCSAEFPLVVGESSDPVYAVVPPINSCTGSPVKIRPIHIAPDPTLPPAAATEVRWYTGPGQTGLIQNGPAPSLDGVTYTIDDTDWLNPELLVEGLPAGAYNYYFYVVCTGQEIEIEVTAYDTPNVELEADKITCFGDTDSKVQVISGADPSYTYSIDGATPISLTEFESQTFIAGNYNLVVATPAGCVQDLNFVIEGPSAPLAASPLTKIDPGCGALNGKLTLTVTGGWVPYSLEVFKNGVSEDIITTSETNITLDEYATGDYKIEIKDALGCVVVTNEVTLVDGPTQVLVTDEIICEGEVATLSPTLDPVAAGSTFQWFIDQELTQEITSSPDPTADGRVYQINAGTGALTIAGLPQTTIPINFYVTASGTSICPGFIGQGSVIVGGTPAATDIVVDELCYGDGGTIIVNASGGSGNYTYSLNGGTFGSSNVFDVDPGIYSIEVRSQEGCSYILDEVEVIGPPAILSTNSLVQDDASCGLDNGEIRFNIEGGYTPYSISYSKNGTSVGTITSTDGKVRISNLSLGTYSWTITDSTSCELISGSPVNIIEVPTTITANGDQICEGETAELIASVSQNIPDPQFTWSFDSQGNNPIIPGEINGVSYDVGPDGQLNITGLLGSGSPYTYYVSATGTGICGLSPKPVMVTISPVANLKVSNPSVVCDPMGRVDLTDYIEGFNSDVYDYNVLSPSGSAMQINEIENVALSGDYRVSSSSKGSNCWNQPQRIRVLISETELIARFEYEVDLGGGNVITNGDVQILEDVQFQDLSQGNTILWNWDFGDGSTSTRQNPTHQFQEKGTYTVILTTIDDIGCQSEFQIIVNVFDDYMVIVPNAFTPGGTKNQFFKPKLRGIASMELYIFNTWGELIYETKSLEDTGWDGTLNGVPTPNGNYVYRGRFVSRSGEIVEKSGVFILIR